MTKKADTSTFSIPVFESNAEFRVNTAHFSEYDLALFIESMETLSRLKRERHERRMQRREIIRATKLMLDTTIHPPTATTTCPSSPVPPAEELPDEPVILLEAKSVSPAPSSVRKASDDENYYSDAGQSQPSSPRSSLSGDMDANKQRLSPSPSQTSIRTILTGTAASDSEESGVFPISADSPPPSNECSTKLHSRSKIQIKPNSRKTRSKIAALIMKREQTESNTNLILDPSRKKSKSNHNLDHNDPALHDFKEQYKRFSMRYLRRKLKTNFSRNTLKMHTAEVERLDKALRYLTL